MGRKGKYGTAFYTTRNVLIDLHKGVFGRHEDLIQRKYFTISMQTLLL